VKLADAHRLLYAQKFDSARAAYQELVGRFPQSAEAYLGLSMACRYSGHRDTALKLDSEAVGALINYANLLLPMRSGLLADMSDSERYAESERCLLKATASAHPFNAHAHIELWTSYMDRAGCPMRGTRRPSSARSNTTGNRCSTSRTTCWSAWIQTQSSSPAATTTPTRSGHCRVPATRSGRT
jgi:tetratricopeptide (TPR) repeat protein